MLVLMYFHGVGENVSAGLGAGVLAAGLWADVVSVG